VLALEDDIESGALMVMIIVRYPERVGLIKHTLKTELTHHRRYLTRIEAQQAISNISRCFITAKDVTPLLASRPQWAMGNNTKNSVIICPENPCHITVRWRPYLVP
jgi:hypothetical protein